jgi:hypothetical protein
LKSRELKIYGFGIPGQGFYALDIDVVAKPRGIKGVGAILKILEGSHSARVVEAELKYWVEEKWQWNVKAISEDEYFVTFPSATALRICMRGGEIVTHLNKMRINLKESDLDPGASSMLKSTWVKIFDIPSDARNEDSLKEISKTFGRPKSIDHNYLNGKGPVRVQVDCKDPKKLRGKIEIFLNTASFKFCIEAEGVVWGLSDLQKPGDSPGDDPDDRAEDDDDDEELGEEWERHRL